MRLKRVITLAVAGVALALGGFGCGTVGGLYQPTPEPFQTTNSAGVVVWETNMVWTVKPEVASAVETIQTVAPALPYGELIGLGAGALLALAGWIGKLKSTKQRNRARAIVTSLVRGVEAGSKLAGESAGGIVKEAITTEALRDGTATDLHAVVKETTK
jgi:hypothetical protein